MFKKLIQRIAEAVRTILLPTINELRLAIIEKLMAQDREVESIKTDITHTIKLANDQKAKLDELVGVRQQLSNLQERIQGQNEDIQKYAENIRKQIEDMQKQIEEVKSLSPLELEERQEEARTNLLMELPQKQKQEKPDYAQIANDIANKCNETNNVVISEDVPYELVSELILQGLAIRFEDSNLVVTKPCFDSETDFDADAIAREFDKNQTLQKRLEVQRFVNLQLAFIKEKYNELVSAYRQNPHLDSYNVDISENGQLCLETSTNPLYTNKVDSEHPDDNYKFFISDEVVDFLRNRKIAIQPCWGNSGDGQFRTYSSPRDLKNVSGLLFYDFGDGLSAKRVSYNDVSGYGFVFSVSSYYDILKLKLVGLRLRFVSSGDLKKMSIK